MPILAVLALATAITSSIHGASVSIDGVIVAETGADWLPDHTLVTDGDDDRYAPGHLFDDYEDIDELKVWIDVPAESVFVAWKTIRPPYPNRAYVSEQGDLDDGTFALLLDLDNDPATGMSTAFAADGTPTEASPAIGSDLGLSWSFRRLGTGALSWRFGRWESDTTACRPTTSAEFGVLHPEADTDTNDVWTEAACSFSDVPAAFRESLRPGHVVSVAALLRTPGLFGQLTEEITDAAYFLIGWGPVQLDGGTIRTVALRNRLGTEVIRSGCLLTYRDSDGVFLVDGLPCSSPLSFPKYGDVTGDGTVSAFDAACILRHVLGTGDLLNRVVADADGDGAVELADAAIALHATMNPLYEPPASSGVPESVGKLLAVQRTGSTTILRGSGTWTALVPMPDAREADIRVLGAQVVETTQRHDTLFVALVATGTDEVRVLRSTAASQEPSTATLRVWPNPCNGQVTLSVISTGEEPIFISVHSIDGRTVRTWKLDGLRTGENSLLWDMTDIGGARVGSGVYVVCATVGERSLVQRLTIVR